MLKELEVFSQTAVPGPFKFLKLELKLGLLGLFYFPNSFLLIRNHCQFLIIPLLQPFFLLYLDVPLTFLEVLREQPQIPPIVRYEKFIWDLNLCKVPYQIPVHLPVMLPHQAHIELLGYSHVISVDSEQFFQLLSQVYRMHERYCLVVLLRFVFILVAYHDFEFRNEDSFAVWISTKEMDLLPVNSKLFLQFIIRYGAAFLTSVRQHEYHSV